MGLFFKETNKGQKAKVISFLNQKGGVGKTTMAYNTACALNELGKSVLCLDLDPQANLSLLFGLEVDIHIHHLLINSQRELKALHVPIHLNDVLKTKNGIDIIPAGQDLSGFELTVAGINFPRQLILKSFLEKNGILQKYDIIIIDGPPTLGLLVVNILCASTGVMVPFRPDEFSKKGLFHFHEVLNSIEEMGIGNNPKVLAHIPNLYDGRRKQEEKDLLEITKKIGEEYPHSIIVKPILNKTTVVKSQALQQSVFAFRGKEFTHIQNQFLELARIIEETPHEYQN